MTASLLFQHQTPETQAALRDLFERQTPDPEPTPALANVAYLTCGEVSPRSPFGEWVMSERRRALTDPDAPPVCRLIYRRPDGLYHIEFTVAQFIRAVRGARTVSRIG